ncbi:MAG TPA: type VI secretion system tip protein VgrG [Stellaceae bacterium]|jgi:type VI secretion system secreted protein VgrG
MDARFSLTTPLGKDVLILQEFEGTESLSQLFRFRLDMVSEQQSIAPSSMLGKAVTWSVAGPADDKRHFSGLVREFVPAETWGRGYRLYHAEVVPWFWLSSRTADCKIFQNKSVKDILQTVLGDNDQADFDLSGIKGSHPNREYCVQYRETDLNFLSRLMEEEGIFYFFRHTEGSHKMIIADDSSAFYTSDDKEVEYGPNTEVLSRLTAWKPRHEFRPGVWAQRDYDFETPTKNLQTTKNTLLDVPANRPYEIFDYPGGYLDKEPGDNLTKLRMEEEEAPYGEVDAQGNCRHFSPGAKFSLTRHDITSEQGDYTISTTQHRAADYSGFVGAETPSYYANSFSCLPSAATFRAPRLTPKPVVHGPQTAIVVGPSGEEIYCDKYGRVKVQFHWDRYGTKDDKSSCFIRVAQWLAGPQWGAIFTPRIGMEVIVEFLEGDPDRPIIVGTVYNGDNMPPYALPDNKTQSGFKSRSSLKGGSSNFNELRFEDKKGDEDIVVHAEKDYHRSVEHNDDLQVGNDQTITIKNDRTETVQQGNDSVTIQTGNRSIEVSLGSSTLEAMQSITLKVGMSSIVIDQTSITLSAMNINILGQLAVTINGVETTVTGSAVLTLSGGLLVIG